MKSLYILISITLSVNSAASFKDKASNENLKQKKEIGLITIKVSKWLCFKDPKLYAVTLNPYCLLTFHSREDSLKAESNLPKKYTKKMDTVAIRALRHFNIMNGSDYPIGSTFYWKIYDDWSIDLDKKSMPQLKSNL